MKNYSIAIITFFLCLCIGSNAEATRQVEMSPEFLQTFQIREFVGSVNQDAFPGFSFQHKIKAAAKQLGPFQESFTRGAYTILVFRNEASVSLVGFKENKMVAFYHSKPW